MKIAMLLDNPFTDLMPYPKRVYYEAKSLVDNGHDVTIYCKNEVELNLPIEEVIDKIKIKRYFNFFLGTSVQIHKYLESNINLYNSVAEKYDVYHCHDTNTWPIGYLLSKRDNAKFICETHEFFPDYICKEWHKDNIFKYELSKMLVKARGAYINYADNVITVSKPMSERLYKIYKLKEKPTVLYNTRPIKNLDFCESSNELRRKYNIDDSIKILLFQGIIEQARGLDVLIKSMKYVNDSVLIIAGVDRNCYIDELKNIIDENKLNDKIIFTGFMPSDELLKASFQADALIYLGKPLVENMELTIPNKFFDYIMSGKPIIVSDLYALKEIVDLYNIGLCVDIHNIDIESIGNKINELMGDDKQLSVYTRNLENIKRIFSWEEEEKKLLKLYNNL